MFSPFWKNFQTRTWMWSFPRQSIEVGALLAKQNRVQILSCQLDEKSASLEIVAKVIESSLTPYVTRLHLQLQQSPVLNGDCSCAVQQGCRHMTALLYAACQADFQSKAEDLALNPTVSPSDSNDAEKLKVHEYEDLRVKPVLVLQKLWIHQSGKAKRLMNVARAMCQYEGLPFLLPMIGASDLHEWQHEETLCRLHRKLDLEREWLRQLRLIGLAPLPEVDIELHHELSAELFGVEQNSELEFWDHFIKEDLPYFQQKGWSLDQQADFGFQSIIIKSEDWLTKLDQQDPSSEQFRLQVQVQIDGESVDLIPLLIEALQSRLQYQDILKHPKREYHFLVPGSTQKLIVIPGQRLAQLLSILYELNLKPKNRARQKESSIDSLQIDRLRAVQLMSLEGSAFQAPERLKDLQTRLADFEHLPEVSLPSTLRAELRPYQKAGVDWLQFLREYQLHGILADDMGLGKTLQAISNLLVEKTRHPQASPSLIVAPTSVLRNWYQEIKKFAPELRVLILQGDQRKDRFVSIPYSDIVLTSYPLILKDAEKLNQTLWHYLILDEAHYIKNAKTKVALTLRQLKAQHRLCLTGTPMENHLGELWSLFAFLMPGYLGDQDLFRTQFRVPIEKYQRKEVLDRLNLKLKPLLLRRTKNQVVKELPPKTELLHLVNFKPAQRDVYETLRALMNQKVQETIAEQGLQKSKMLVLEALLKLRQVCCHPQLLDLPQAPESLESAKTRFLIDELLPTLMEQGRRILLFSQFTTLLQLLEKEIQSAGIPYVTLTGKDKAEAREKSIQSFKRGDVALFLISLKAGGVGLNLTEADTIIHYDPWWNPAVEQQATDRAHRIGQTQPVFIHKLICQDSIEERIVELQRTKQNTLQQLLDGSISVEKLRAEDLLELLRPL